MKIELIDNNLSERDKKVIIELASEHAADLDVHVFNKKSKIFPYMKAREKLRTSEYMNRVGTVGYRGANLIVCRNPDGDIIGYLLYVCGVNNPKIKSIISTVVVKKYRKQGILSSMLTALFELSNAISLTCKVSNIPLYEKFGFKVSKQWETMVGMSTDISLSDSIMTVDEDFLANHHYVKSAWQSLSPTNPKKVTKWYNEMVKDSQKEIKDVTAFFANNYA